MRSVVSDVAYVEYMSHFIHVMQGCHNNGTVGSSLLLPFGNDTGGCPDNRRAKLLVVIAVEILSPLAVDRACVLVLMRCCKILVALRMSQLATSFVIQTVIDYQISEMPPS